MARLGWGALLLASMSAFGTAGAQESAGERTRAEALCQAATSAALGDFADAYAGCLANCRTAAATDPSRHCGAFDVLDGETAACLTVARARATIAATQRCVGAACPECYARGDCVGFDQNALADMEQQMRYANYDIFCTDSGGDGLTPAEAQCQQKAFLGVGKLYRTISRCVGRCQRSRTGSADGCFVADLAAPAFDDGAQRCIVQARKRFLSQCASKCADQPECGFANCETLYRDVYQAFVPPYGRAGESICVDHTVCGDTFISGAEQCDTGLYPSGCGGATSYCNSQCQCEAPPYCGDGRISGFESCDQSATPTGCPSGTFCNYCNYCSYPYCGDGYVNGTEDCDINTASTCAGNEVCSNCQCREVVDACTQVQDIPAAGGLVSGTTSGFSTQQGTCGSSPAPENAYRWTPVTSGIAVVDSCLPGNFFHTLVYVRQNSCTGPQLVCADHSSAFACLGSHAGQAVFPVVAGTDYYVFIDAWGGESGSYTLNVIPPSSASGAFVD